MKTVIPLKKWIFSGALVSALAVNSSFNILAHNSVSEEQFELASSCESAGSTNREEYEACKQVEAEKNKSVKADQNLQPAAVGITKKVEELAKKEEKKETAGQLPCTGPECARLAKVEAALVNIAAKLEEKYPKSEKKADDSKKEDEKKDEKSIAQLTKEKLERIDKNCRNERDHKRVKCYSDELVSLLKDHVDKKKLDMSEITSFYKDNIHKDLKGLLGTDMLEATYLRDKYHDNAVAYNTGLDILKRFERELPSDYNDLRRLLVATTRESLAEKATEVSTHFRDSKLAADAKDPVAALASMQQGKAAYQNLMELINGSKIAKDINPGIKNILYGSLDDARSSNTISKSFMDLLYDREFVGKIVPWLKKLQENPYREIKIVDGSGHNIGGDILDQMYGRSTQQIRYINERNTEIINNNSRSGRGTFRTGNANTRQNISGSAQRVNTQTRKVVNGDNGTVLIINGTTGNIEAGSLGTRSNNQRTPYRQ